MKMSPHLSRALFSGLVLLLPLAVYAASYVRVVRLSLVKGDVRVERPSAQEPQAGVVNLPLVHGAAVETGNGAAEVEFETGAYARLAGQTRLDFTELVLLDNGGRVTTLTLEDGTATFSARRHDDDTFLVVTPYFQVSVPNRAKFRVDLTETGARVRVFSGKVRLEGVGEPVSLGQGRMYEWLEKEQTFALVRNTARDAWDEWNDDRDETLAANTPDVVPARLRYGASDLARYGRWRSLSGFGWVWQPSVGPGWGPFSHGRWLWYPPFGWTWISFDPWGWLPSHFGSWWHDPFYGWIWLPDFFDFWSPGRCVWLRQPGWIGWAPIPARVAPGPVEASPGLEPPPGTVIVSEDGFTRGEPTRRASELEIVNTGRWEMLDAPPAEITAVFQRPGSPGAGHVPLRGIQGTEADRNLPAAGTRLTPAGEELMPQAQTGTSEQPRKARVGASQPEIPVATQTGKTQGGRERGHRPFVPLGAARVDDAEWTATQGAETPTVRTVPLRRGEPLFRQPNRAPSAPTRSAPASPRPSPQAAPRPAPAPSQPAARPPAPRPAPAPAPRSAPQPPPRPAPPPRAQ